MHTLAQKSFLLSLARRGIEHYLENRVEFLVDENDVELTLREERGTFVTITLDGALRGCIGHIEAIQPLYLDVMENAVSAAFRDPRFAPLTEAELPAVRIEISVLSKPEEVRYSDAEELLSAIRPHEDGLIVRSGLYSATYLPQVWDQLPEKERFLSSLCLKAGLDADTWRCGYLEVQRYTVESFEEGNDTDTKRFVFGHE